MVPGIRVCQDIKAALLFAELQHRTPVLRTPSNAAGSNEYLQYKLNLNPAMAAYEDSLLSPITAASDSSDHLDPCSIMISLFGYIIAHIIPSPEVKFHDHTCDTI